MNLLPGILSVASLAPSFPAYFDCHPLQLVTALKLAGFDFVEETVVVLPEILAMRQHYLSEMGPPLLGESCPKINQLVSNFYPHLTEFIPPVPSPMELHGRQLKEKYGTSCQTVFVSPCIHKKQENAYKKAMDLVVTFSELKTWLDQKIDSPLQALDKTDFDSKIDQKAARLGVLVLGVHGATSCEQFLKAFPTKQVLPFSELLYCQGGCLQSAWQSLNGDESAADRILKTWEDYA